MRVPWQPLPAARAPSTPTCADRHAGESCGDARPARAPSHSLRRGAGHPPHSSLGRLVRCCRGETHCRATMWRGRGAFIALRPCVPVSMHSLRVGAVWRTARRRACPSRRGPSTSRRGPSTSQRGPSTSRRGPSPWSDTPSQGPACWVWHGAAPAADRRAEPLQQHLDYQGQGGLQGPKAQVSWAGRVGLGSMVVCGPRSTLGICSATAVFLRRSRRLPAAASQAPFTAP